MSVASPVRPAIPAVILARTEPRPEPRPAHRRSWGAWWVYVGLLIGLVFLVGPFLWMLASSVKTSAELHHVPPTWIPQTFTLENYTTIFTKLNFPQYFINSVIVSAFVVGSNLLFCSMIGYALAKLRFPGKNAIFLVVLATLMVPQTVYLVPLFVLMSNLGLVNSYAGMILPFAAQALGVFLMRQYILSLPDELLEAARMDGAGEFTIFRRVVLPLLGAPLATLGILMFLGSWNNFLWPLIIATSDHMYTLPVAVATFSIGQNAVDYGLLMAGSVVLIAPVLTVFLLLQRFVQQGIATTGLKG
ncbi:MAG TPA: carbohydrate ABC transporter permease [Candidatus Dormibacteraeota bacterium]|nr:carbohydrate ABC transporter permease [Candidatus Dormibacteraeota bacterium]